MNRPLNILVACEESQAVCLEFRKRGHLAFSNDIQECSGGHPEWHLQMDTFEAIKLKEWDMMIAFPPCTHLAVSGARWFPEKKSDGRQKTGIDFLVVSQFEIFQYLSHETTTEPVQCP